MLADALDSLEKLQLMLSDVKERVCKYTEDVESVKRLEIAQSYSLDVEEVLRNLIK